MKRYFCLILIFCLILAGCGNQGTNSSVKSTDASPEVQETVPFVEPESDANEKLTNLWNIMDNECVEEISILPGLLIDDIKGWMKETEFTEIKLYQRTFWNSVRLGVYGDVAVARMSMLQDNNLDGEELVWNVRMEKSSALKNKTAISIPEGVEPANVHVLNEQNETIPGLGYFWENGDGTCTEMYLFYYEDTHNLYTFYSNEVVYTQAGGQWTSNSGRSPFVVLNYIAGDGDEYYNWPNQAAIDQGKNSEESILSYFRISVLGDVRTYQYQVGTNLYQWVFSEYNTDGWTTTARNDGIIVSADGRYSLAAERYPWRVVRPEVYGSITNTDPDIVHYPYGSVQRTEVESPLRLEGMYIYSPTFHDECSYRYGLTELSDTYCMNDTLLISGIGVTPEELENMELIMIPHTPHDKTQEDIMNDQTHNSAYGWPYGNDYATVRQNGTVLKTEYREIETLGEYGQYLKRIHVDPGIFVADYQPMEDPNFSPYRDMDIAIACDGQIVYWVFLNQFYTA